MGFLRYQQVAIESGGVRRELPPSLYSTVRARYQEGDQSDAVVSVWGVSADTVAMMRAPGATVDVVAGYVRDGPSPGEIVRGIVIPGTVRETWREGEHWIEAHVWPADVRAESVVPPRAWESTTGAEVLDYLLSSTGITIGQRPPDRGASYAGGYSVSGDPVRIVATIAEDAGWRWSMSRGVLDIWSDEGGVVADIGRETGMIESAERIDEDRIRVVSQLRPDIRPGSLVQVRSRALGQGGSLVRVVVVDYDADNREGAFTVAIEGEEVRR